MRFRKELYDAPRAASALEAFTRSAVKFLPGLHRSSRRHHFPHITLELGGDRAIIKLACAMHFGDTRR